MAGVDTKAKTRNKFYDSISTLYPMHQCNIESNYSYLNRFKENVQTVELAKGTHIFYAQNLMTASDPENPTATEINNDRDKFKDIFFLNRYDKGSYGMIIQDIKEYAWKVRNDLPTSVSGIYDLIFRHSGMLESGKRGDRQGKYCGDNTKVMFYQKGV